MPTLRKDLARLLDGLDFDGEWDALRRDGSRIWLHSRRTVLKDQNLQPIGFLGIGKDITRQKQEAEAVRQSERLYRALGESIDFGVWSCDPGGRITHMSDSFMKMLGLTPAQNLTDAWLNALHADERQDILHDWKECVRKGLPWSRRYRIRGADGLYHAVHAHAAPVRGDQGEIICWLGLNLDIEKLSA